MRYYLHDTNSFNDEKITELYMKFGYEGLGLFYTILEKLALQEKPIKTEVLKSQLKVGKKLEKVWKFMESLDIISSNNGETFNKQLLKFSEKYKIKNEKNKMRLANWREKQDSVTRYERVRNACKDNISKDNISKDNIITPTVLEDKPQSFGREDINQVTETFKKTLGGSLDGTIAENRKYAKLLIDKLKKDYPEYETTKQVQYLIEAGNRDDFHKKNTTSFKYLYYNAQKIIQSVKNNKGGKLIDIT